MNFEFLNIFDLKSSLCRVCRPRPHVQGRTLPIDPMAVITGLMGAAQAIQAIQQAGQAIGGIVNPGGQGYPSGGQGYPGSGGQGGGQYVPTCLACDNDNADCNWQFHCTFRGHSGK